MSREGIYRWGHGEIAAWLLIKELSSIKDKIISDDYDLREGIYESGRSRMTMDKKLEVKERMVRPIDELIGQCQDRMERYEPKVKKEILR